MIRKIDDNFTLTCDTCGCNSDEFSSWDSVLDYKRYGAKKDGWSWTKKDGEWRDLCAKCGQEPDDEEVTRKINWELMQHEPLLESCPLCGRKMRATMQGNKAYGYWWRITHDNFSCGEEISCKLFADDYKSFKNIDDSMRYLKNFVKRWNKRQLTEEEKKEIKKEIYSNLFLQSRLKIKEFPTCKNGYIKKDDCEELLAIILKKELCE